MKNRQRMAMVLLLMMVFSFGMSFGAEETLEDIGIKLKALELLIGDPDGNMRFKDNISRAEFAIVAARSIGKEKESLTRKGATIFKDVPKDHWASGHINVSVDQGLIKGYEDGTFGIKKNITYGEVLTILVNALGYGREVPPENWPSNFVQKAAELGITKGMKFDSNTAATRGDVARMLNNSLSIILK